ncbi:hypothetical protein BC835DRAFT_623984 [Cytidiella melzeri]|nr:hypothetical protein BC835DRAFT_623984 [Cytidiella melzeri]
MANTSSSAWMPAAGRYPAKVGKSLARVIKARKNEPLQKSKFPEPDFYSLRYNFIPPSVDSAKPGTIDVRKGQDTTTVTVERANSQCVLIYDEVLGSFTLEKLDSYVNLIYDRKTAKTSRHTGSPLPSSRPSTSNSTASSNAPLANSVKKRPQTAAEQLEAELERIPSGADQDAVGNPEDDYLASERQRKPAPPKKDTQKEKTLSFTKTRAPPSLHIAKREEEEEESEGEVKRATSTTARAAPVTAAQPKAQVKAKGKNLAAAVAAIRSKAVPTMAATPPPAPLTAQVLSPPVPPTHPLPPKPLSSSLASSSETSRKPSKTLSPKKRELPQDTPTQPPAAKKARPSPPPRAVPTRPPPKIEPPKKKEPVCLALPGSEGVALPSAPLDLPGPSRTAPTLLALPADDSEDEEWDEVLQTTSTSRKQKSPEPQIRRIEMIEIIPEPSAHVNSETFDPDLGGLLDGMEEVNDFENSTGPIENLGIGAGDDANDSADEYEAIEVDEEEVDDNDFLESELTRELEAHLGDTWEEGVGDDDDSDDVTTSDESD